MSKAVNPYGDGRAAERIVERFSTGRDWLRDQRITPF